MKARTKQIWIGPLLTVSAFIFLTLAFTISGMAGVPFLFLFMAAFGWGTYLWFEGWEKAAVGKNLSGWMDRDGWK